MDKNNLAERDFDLIELNKFISSEKNLAEEFVLTAGKDDIIVLWGAGKALYWYEKYFEIKGIYASFIVDKIQHGKTLYGCPVISAEDILTVLNLEKVKIVITTPKYKKEVIQEIQQLIGKVKIYSFEAEIYYTFLNDIQQYRRYLLSNIDDFSLLYNDLNDEKSKATLIAFIKGRISANQDYFAEVMVDDQYFPHDIVVLNDKEVIVEAGSNDGSTLKDMLRKTEGKFKRIYCFEPDLLCISSLEKIINETNKPITLIKKGVGAASGEMKFKTDSVHGGSKIVYSGRYDYKIDVTTIDEEIKQHVSMIKMNIEGLELDALKRCKRILSEDAPRLAICVYHRINDIIEIWKFLKKTQPQYKFYLRHHNWGATETVLYAITKKTE